jgi:hypothetical protein
MTAELTRGARVGPQLVGADPRRSVTGGHVCPMLVVHAYGVYIDTIICMRRILVKTHAAR